MGRFALHYYCNEDMSVMGAIGFEGKIYSVPGHTKGSICIIDEQGNLICGDLYSNNDKPALS